MSRPFAVASSDSLPSVPPFLALAVRPLPLLPLEVALAGFLRRVCDRNPRVFDRLGAHAAKRFGIKPTDLPFAFVIDLTEPRPRLSVVREFSANVDARISSSLANLLALVEGRLDGDALMFSRQLVVEGDVEAVLALRNAIDDAGFDLVEEIAGIFGPLGEPVRRVLSAARNSILAASPPPEEIASWN